MNKLLQVVGVMESKLPVLFKFICELGGVLGRDRPVIRNCSNTIRNWVLIVGGLQRGWPMTSMSVEISA